MPHVVRARFDLRARIAYVTAVAEKRKLPVIQSREPKPTSDDLAAGDPEPEDRPPWHWVGFGTVGIFGAWLPLMGVAQWASNQLLARTFGTTISADGMRMLANMEPAVRARVGMYLAVPHALALGLASVAGGFLVGRYSKGLGGREASIAGVALAIIVGGLTFGAVGVAGFFTTLMLAVPFAGLGGYLGKKQANKRSRHE